MENKSLLKLDSGWLGKLDLGFSLKDGRSVLTKYGHVGPFFIQKCFYPEIDQINPHVYLLHPPGGLVGGDKLLLTVILEPGSQALLTTPGFTKFYRTNGMFSSQKYVFKLLKNTILEWIPQGSIFFPETKAKISTVFELEKGARMISFEMFCFNSLNIDDSYINLEEIDIDLHIRLPYSVGLRNRLKMNFIDCMSKLSGFRIIANLFAVPADITILKKVRQLISRSTKDLQIGGVSLLDDLLVVRVLSNDNQKLKLLLYQIWINIRPFIVKKKAVIPRVWFT